ncbi:hypothetical protein SAMN05421543_14810 [Alicyclobacillus macrosporangiidus]|uniref:Uncharacterized protein n=1 Tax=Alicyclobacillus macrosporangiidus TaxID=392015 RepID=A0A1I7LGX7_9BACL|nr:hypothetical protein SAMN05421543_14810 [Alicyclobacillus macrosporangiidus]
MIWAALFTAVAIAILDKHALRRANRREVTVYWLLVMLAVAMSALVSWHLWPNVHLLAPFDAAFGPVTKWMYEII